MRSYRKDLKLKNLINRMGLGLFVEGIVNKRGLFKSISSGEKTLKKIEEFFINYDDEFLKKFIKINKEDKLLVHIHPAEEPIEFYFDNNKVICSAKTSDAGPGYHNYIISLIEELGKKLDINWIWEIKEGCADETDYERHKDFQKLQEEMILWLDSICKLLLSKKSLKWNLAFDLSIFQNQIIVEDYYALTPMGFYEKKWFENFLKSNYKEKYKLATDFFPWFEKDKSAKFWLNLARTYMNQYIPWHKPFEDNERKDIDLVLFCLEKAYKMDNSLDFPWESWIELVDLKEDSDKINEIKKIMKKDISSQKWIYKRLMRRPLTGYWSVVVPGSFYFREENEKQTALYFDINRNVRATCFRIENPNSYKNIMGNSDKMLESFKEKISFKNKEYSGEAGIKITEENGESFWILQGTVTNKKGLALLSITFHEDKERLWAIKTWKSVEYHEPEN